MPETFVLTVQYKNQDRDFDAELRMLGYTHKIAIIVDEVEIIFEPDEERNYRAVVLEDNKQKLHDPELIKTIALELQAAFK